MSKTSRIPLSPRVGEKRKDYLLYSDPQSVFYNFLVFLFLSFPWQLNIYPNFIVVDRPAWLVALSFKICYDSYLMKE